jgi:exodeoxyribonuclease-3
MRIASWNVNGIRAVLRKSLWEPFVDQIEADIICLQETKAEAEQVETVLKPGYFDYWHSAEKKGYSGTVILSKKAPISVAKGLNVIHIKDSPPHSGSNTTLDTSIDNTLDNEGRVITLEFQDFYLVNVYTPNAQNELRRLPFRHKVWDPAFRQHLLALEKQKPVIFCGDLNVAHKPIDLARPKANESSPGYTPEERAGFTALVESGFDDSFRLLCDAPEQYSWWSYRANARAKNIGWRIDYVCTSQKIRDKVKSAQIHPDILGSDHCPVSVDIKRTLRL